MHPVQALPSTETSRDGAVPFTACAWPEPWGPGSHAVQLNHERHAAAVETAPRDRWSPLPGTAAPRPSQARAVHAPIASTAVPMHGMLPSHCRLHQPAHASCSQLPQVQSLRLKHRASGGGGATARVHPKPMGTSGGPAQALALLNTSSLAHRGQLAALPCMSNLLPHGPFGAVPSDTQQGSGMGGSGSGGPCSPFRPAAACSQVGWQAPLPLLLVCLRAARGCHASSAACVWSARASNHVA